MTRWEYREVIWQPAQLMVTIPNADDEATVDTMSSAEWYPLLARLGEEGWELINCTGAPTGIHEYYFYFKRPIED
jgi:Tfp pilus assembly protein PilV